jgi:hypothetical protein
MTMLAPLPSRLRQLWDGEYLTASGAGSAMINHPFSFTPYLALQ